MFTPQSEVTHQPTLSWSSSCPEVSRRTSKSRFSLFRAAFAARVGAGRDVHRFVTESFTITKSSNSLVLGAFAPKYLLSTVVGTVAL